jgi:hypothetical protein
MLVDGLARSIGQIDRLDLATQALDADGVNRLGHQDAAGTLGHCLPRF